MQKTNYILTDIMNKYGLNFDKINELYTYKESIIDLEKYFRLHIDKSHLDYFLSLIEDFKEEKKIPMRFVNVALSKYQKEMKIIMTKTKEEDKLLAELMYYWG